jgi:hypothetical protein
MIGWRFRVGCGAESLPHSGPTNRRRGVATMSKQRIGNALAGILFLVIAIVDFVRDSSGIGAVFVVFAAVFLGLAFSGWGNGGEDASRP